MTYDQIASKETIDKTMAALKDNNFEPLFVGTKEEALNLIKSLIPAGASIQNGSSRTLEQIGFVDYLKSKEHSWNNLHDAILEEKDPGKQAMLRKQAVLSDYYLGSVHALSETGEMVIASNSGSQLPHIAFTSPNIIFVVGAQKIVPTLVEGMKRLEEYVVPLEDENMKTKYGYGTMLCKELLLRKENPALGRKVRVVIVSEKLGF